MTRSLSTFMLLLLLAPVSVSAARGKPAKGAEEKAAKQPELLAPATFAGLTLRNIGPAVTSGRIVDVAIPPAAPDTWWVASASGGVWKSDNAGISWTPVFDGEGSYSIGCVSVDPNNPAVVWVGSGENNSQRSVSYGDGVYKTVDGGKTWKNMGLKDSQHIAKVLVDPRDSDTVYVAAQGPLWNAGGDRGLYKTVDGGKTWTKSLDISKDTGVTDVAFDPRDPDVLYAASYQRRRHVWTLIDGGPESALYKSEDAGKTWRKLENGLPKGDLGRIGIAVSPADPDVVYAIIEAIGDKGGFYRSSDRGESWERRSDYVSGSPQYYQEIFADPKDVDRVYSMDTFMQVTTDGGKTFGWAGEHQKHVDNHVVWIDPRDTSHLVAGCDGGLYESFDRAASWRFVPNLPVTQFYKLALDNAKPFYNVYGGTQDNFSLGGPSQTTSSSGIVNSDWFVTAGGDGFQPRVDPDNPNIVYAESQYGGLVRFDRASGDMVDIQPQPGAGEPPLRWNWDSPLIVSPHKATRLYFGANRLFRSDDRGDSWTPVSPDLTRKIDRNHLKIMGRVWPIDSVAKNASTSFYGNIVSLSESPEVEGLLYVGTDDGLIQVSEDGGGAWRQIETFPGVPAHAYVSYLQASNHDADTVFAAFDNHKMGDFKPYLLKSTDRGRTWTSIAGDLPEKGTVYAVIQDPVEPGLLFAGTELGAYFTLDGGGHWVELTGGMPTIAVRDLAIQKDANDLVLATFGRGFYVLDDITPLRGLSKKALEQDSILFPVTDPRVYNPDYSKIGIRGHGFQGASYFTADNPPYGAVFTYYLKKSIESLKEKREKAEADLVKADKPVEIPTWEELRKEDREAPPMILFTVKDGDGHVVRRITAPAKAGIHRVSWDLHFPPATPVRLQSGDQNNPFSQPPSGPMTAPGTFSVQMAEMVDGKITPMGQERTFTTRPLALETLPATDRDALEAFQRQTADLQRAVLGAVRAAGEAQTRIDSLKKALLDTPAADQQLMAKADELETRLKDLEIQLEGDPVPAEHNEPTAPSIVDRVQQVVYGSWGATAAPTETHRRNFEIAGQEFSGVLAKLRTLVETDLAGLENQVEDLGGPWTPGRVPRWSPPK